MLFCNCFVVLLLLYCTPIVLFFLYCFAIVLFHCCILGSILVFSGATAFMSPFTVLSVF